MNTHYAPQTPPRRAGQRSRLTPSATPFATPSKTPAFGTAKRSLLLSNKTPSRSRVTQHYSTEKQRSTPYFTASQGSPCTVEHDKSTNDRFIPSRRFMNMDLCRRSLNMGGEKRPRGGELQKHNKNDETPLQKEFKRRMLSTLCNVPLEKLTEDSEAMGILTFGGAKPMIYDARKQPLLPGPNNTHTMLPDPYALDMLRTMKVGGSHSEDDLSQQSVASKILRKVPSAPIRILDAPDIVDDYYLNLISWSKDNILAVALAKSVYLWNATTGAIHHLFTVGEDAGESAVDYITSVSWCQEPGQTKYIAVGTQMNALHIFDGHALKKIRTLRGATGRIASLAWTNNMLSAGDRDATIINHDVRADQNIVSKFSGHGQEVCGLKWNDSGQWRERKFVVSLGCCHVGTAQRSPPFATRTAAVPSAHAPSHSKGTQGRR